MITFYFVLFYLRVGQIYIEFASDPNNKGDLIIPPLSDES